MSEKTQSTSRWQTHLFVVFTLPLALVVTLNHWAETHRDAAKDLGNELLPFLPATLVWLAIASVWTRIWN
jgi:hypothetical protein